MKLGLVKLFELHHDQKDADAIDAGIRQGMRFEGTNLWVLIFAILIASIGLNVNSTAVIIGAMLVSPLMGPITAVGYGAGINDTALIREGLRNLAIFAGISLLTSSLYFLLSPLSEAQSELLARTKPTLWDVLVAFCGGAAGIVAQTRRDVSPVIPGVAIATALMPPLCTAGYGLAAGDAQIFLGAAYLFAINSVFIAYATLLFVKVLKLPRQLHVNERTQKKTRLLVGLCIAATVIPSAYLAYVLVQDELFETSAKQVIRELDQSKDSILFSHAIVKDKHQVTLTFGGKPPADTLARDIERRINGAGVPKATVYVRYVGGDRIDVNSLKRELERNVSQFTADQIAALSQRIQSLSIENTSLKADALQQDKIIDEIRAHWPDAERVVFGRAKQHAKGETAAKAVQLVVLTTRRPLAKTEQERLSAWLRVRLTSEDVVVVFDNTRLDAQTGNDKT